MGLVRYFFTLRQSGASRRIPAYFLVLLGLIFFSVGRASQGVISKEKEEIPAKTGVEAADEISAAERKFIESIDAEDAEVVARLSKANRGNALAALKAGYKHIRLIGSNYTLVMMLNPNGRQGIDRRFQHLVSFKNERKYSRNGKSFEFLSVISDVSYNCEDFSFKTYRQEYKSSKFGLGESIMALVPNDGKPSVKVLKSADIRKYFDSYVCN